MHKNRAKHKWSHFWPLLAYLGAALLSSKCLANPWDPFLITEPDKGTIITGRPLYFYIPGTPFRADIDYQSYRVTEITSFFSTFNEMEGLSMKFEPT